MHRLWRLRKQHLFVDAAAKRSELEREGRMLHW